MTLIKSISGIRGTIGGLQGDGLSPIDVTKFTSAYVQWIKETKGISKGKIVIGRDARISGAMVNRLVTGSVMSMGFDAIDPSMLQNLLLHMYNGLKKPRVSAKVKL